MSEENESLVLGVEFDGAQGVNQFVSALQPLPSRVEALFSQMGTEVGGASAWAEKGRDVVRAYYAAAQAEMAGFKGVGGDNLVDSVMKSAGLTKPQMAEMRDVLSQISEIHRKTGTGAFGSKDYDQGTLLGLQGAERTTKNVETAQRRLEQQLERTQKRFEQLSRVYNAEDGVLDPTVTGGKQRQLLSGDATTGVQWTQYAKSAARTLGLELPAAPESKRGEPLQGRAEQTFRNLVAEQTKTARETLEAMRLQQQMINDADPVKRVATTAAKAAAPTAVEAVKQAPEPVRPQPSVLQSQIIDRLGRGQTYRDVTAEGYTYHSVQAAAKQFAPEIEAQRAQIASAAQAAREREYMQQRLGGSARANAVDLAGVTDYRARQLDKSDEYAAMVQKDLEDRYKSARVGGTREDARAEVGISDHRARELDRVFEDELAARRRFVAEMQRDVPGRAEAADVRNTQGRQAYDQQGVFNDREQPYAPSAEDRYFREMQNISRGGQGFGKGAPTEGYSAWLAARFGSEDADPDAALRAWQERQNRGSLYELDAKRYESVWANIPQTNAEQQVAREREEMIARVRANSAQVREDGEAGLGLSRQVTTQQVTRNMRTGEFELEDRISTRTQRLLRGEDFARNLEQSASRLTGADYRMEDGKRVGIVRGNQNVLNGMGESSSMTETELMAQRARLTEAFGGQNGWRQQFMAGFSTGPKGGDDSAGGTAHMVGQTARISLFYGAAYRALNMLQDALSLITQETLAYEASLTDLNVATQRGRTENQSLADDLSSTAAEAAYAPSVGVALGARSMGLYGTAQASQAEQERTAKISAEVSTRVARVAGGDDPVAVQTQLAGALRSFGYGIDRLSQVEDSITYIARNTGQSPTELLGATSNIATLGRSSGFTPEQLMAIVAQVGTTTGQNPEATAGQFRQVLSREFDVVAESARQTFGLNTEGMSSVAQVLEAVSKMDSNQQQINDFTASFGKGGSQTVAMITLENWDRIQQLSAGASGATGMGEETFNQVMNNIGNQFKQFGAEFGETGVALINTGLLDWLGALVMAASGVVDVVGSVLNIFNEIPRPIRSVALALGEIYLASKLIAGLNVTGALAGLGGVSKWIDGLSATAKAQGVGAAASQVAGSVRSGVSNISLVRPAAESAALRLQARDTNLSLGQRAVAGVQGGTRLTGAGALLGLAAVAVVGQQVVESFQRVSESGKALSLAQTDYAKARTADQYLDVAAQASKASEEIRSTSLDGLAVGDVANLIPSIVNSIYSGGERAELSQIATNASAKAAEIQERQAASEKARVSAVFTDFSEEGISASLETLSSRGYNAREQLELLNDAMFRLRDAAASVDTKTVTAALSRDQFAGVASDASSLVSGVITGAAEGRQIDRDATVGDWWLTNRILKGSEISAADADIDALTFDDKRLAELEGSVSAAIMDQLEGLSVGDLAFLDEDDIARMRLTISEKARSAFTDEEWSGLSEQVRTEITTLVSNRAGQLLSAISGELSPENLSAYLSVLPALAASSGQEVTRETGSSTRGAQATLDALTSYRPAIQGALDEGQLSADQVREVRNIDVDIAEAKRNVMESRISDIQRITSLRQGYLSDDDTLGRLQVEASGLEQELAAAREQYQGSMQLDTSAATPYQYKGDETALRAIQDAELKQAQNARSQAMEQLRQRQAAMTAYVSPGDSIGTAGAQLSSVNAALSSGLYTTGSSEWLGLQQQRTQAAFSYRQTAIQGRNANALASIDPRANVERIRQQITNAQREMSLYAARDPQMGQLRDQIAQLRQQEREALVSEANALASSQIAGRTSGLQQAEVAVANAQRTLSVQLGGTEGYYTALTGLREAQAQLAAQELAQADRVARLSSDLTDPVEQARLDVDAALDKYRADMAAGEGADVTTQDQLDITSARNRQEAAAFSQRLSDVQIAEDLGRMSHSAYMGYLQSEHDRLSAVGNRTRQQQDQLNQIDQLMKSAAEEMQGQWNIGDIDLPTVYEMRRAIGSGAPTQVADYSNSNNVVNISGADFAAVVEWITQYVGAGAQTVIATSGRK